jgi:glycosyltransferase involved in cell wall biosynthesis
MRIVQVTPSLEARHGGPSKSVHALAAAQARAGDEVELLATDPGPDREESEGALRIRRFHRDWPQSICVSAGLRRELRSAEPEVVHHHSVWLRTLHYAHRCAVRSGASLVISPRGMLNQWAWEHHARRKRWAARLIHPGALAAAAGWHATSEEEAREIRARGFVQPICVAPNGVDAPTAEQSALARAHWLEAWPELADRPVALFYSRFHRKKRVIELIDAWLEQAPTDWLLLLVGIPEDYNAEALNAYALRALASDRIRAFDGADRPAPYAVASLFLLPSHSENFGLAIAEAMAHGVPGLVTDATPWGALNSLELGWCVPWADYAAALRLATAESPSRLRERGARARSWVLDHFSWDQSVATLAAFYRTLRA